MRRMAKLVWQYALPVGSSATPISYVSPVTGKQYIVISVAERRILPQR